MGMICKKLQLLFLLLALLAQAYSQGSPVIKVFFRYGSIPATGFENSEYEEIGGIRGGHVSLGIDSLEIGFTNIGWIHVFPHKEDYNAVYYIKHVEDFLLEIQNVKFVIFEVPLSTEQYHKLKAILHDYVANTPYDYAFFGMRCASATYEVLSQIGLFEPLPRGRNVISNFYPRLFRLKMFRLARQENYTITRQKGRISRIWEED